MLCLDGSEIRRQGLKTNAGLTESLSAWDSEKKFGLNELWYSINWSPNCQTSYPGGNRLVAGESTHRPRGLVHRCRPKSSWWCRSHQRLGCSSIKDLHELGSVRRETVRQYLLGVHGRLKERILEYERNEDSAPLVYRLCKASPGSHARRDKT
jgi:hypothetical protein